MKVGDLLIDESEIVETFVRSSGPGGQNVNKVASAVELRFDARRSPSLPNDVAIRLSISLARARRRTASSSFSRKDSPASRATARTRAPASPRSSLRAQEREKPRRPTKPTHASRAPPRGKEPAGGDQGA